MRSIACDRWPGADGRGSDLLHHAAHKDSIVLAARVINAHLVFERLTAIRPFVGQAIGHYEKAVGHGAETDAPFPHPKTLLLRMFRPPDSTITRLGIKRQSSPKRSETDRNSLAFAASGDLYLAKKFFKMGNLASNANSCPRIVPPQTAVAVTPAKSMSSFSVKFIGDNVLSAVHGQDYST